MKAVWEDTGVKPPPLVNMPQIQPDEMPYYEAFRKLSFSRQYSDNGPQAISIGEIRDYLGNISPDKFEDWIDVMQAMDAEFLEDRRSKIKAEMDKAAKKGAKK